MEAHEVADEIRKTVEEEQHGEASFRKTAAIIIGVMGLVLAVAALSTENVGRAVLATNVKASDTYASYEAKTIRQTSNQLAADQLEALLLTQPALPAAARSAIQQRIDREKATAARYESEPATGDGKKELLAKARANDASLQRLEHQLPNFEIAQGLVQIGIVLGSVSMVATARWLLGVSIGLTVIALLLLLNGHLLLVELPFG